MLKKIENILVGILMFLPFIGNAQIYLNSNFNNNNLTGWTAVPSGRWIVNNLDLRTSDIVSSGQTYAYHSLTGLDVTAKDVSWEFTITDLVNPYSTNNWGVWLYANETNLVAKNGTGSSSTIQGYFFGVNIDATTDDIYRLYKVEGNNYSIVIDDIHTDSESNLETNNWRITRTINGEWKVFLEKVLPATVTAPESSKGTGLDATYTTATYFGVYQEHTSSNDGQVRFDDILVAPVCNINLATPVSPLTSTVCPNTPFTVQIDNIQEDYFYFLTETQYDFSQGSGSQSVVIEGLVDNPDYIGGIAGLEGSSIIINHPGISTDKVYNVLAIHANQYGCHDYLTNQVNIQVDNVQTSLDVRLSDTPINGSLDYQVCSGQDDIHLLQVLNSQNGATYQVFNETSNEFLSIPSQIGNGGYIEFEIPVPTDVSTTVYSIKVITDFGCEAFLDDKLTSTILPEISQDILTKTHSVCEGDPVSINILNSQPGVNYSLCQIVSNNKVPYPALDQEGNGNLIPFTAPVETSPGIKEYVFSASIETPNGSSCQSFVGFSKSKVYANNEKPQLLISEIGQGPKYSSNDNEYVEFIVDGPPCCSNAGIDIRGWRIDDNNDNEDVFKGGGSKPGFKQFSDNELFKDLKVGTKIIIYNPKGQKFNEVPIASPVDESLYVIDVDASDYEIVLPISDETYFKSCTGDSRSATSCDNTALNSWTSLLMDNFHDSFQVFNPDDDSQSSSVSWGDNAKLALADNLSLPNMVLLGSYDEDGTYTGANLEWKIAYFNNGSNDIISDSEQWSSTYLNNPDGSPVSPAIPNSYTEQNAQAWINTLTNSGSLVMKNDLAVSDPVICGGEATITVSNPEVGVEYCVTGPDAQEVCNSTTDPEATTLDLVIQGVTQTQVFSVSIKTGDACKDVLTDVSTVTVIDHGSLVVSDPTLTADDSFTIISVVGVQPTNFSYQLYGPDDNTIGLPIDPNGDNTVSFQVSPNQTTQYIIESIYSKDGLTCKKKFDSDPGIVTYIGTCSDGIYPVINEFSQGDGSSKEYVEIVIAGKPKCSCTQAIDLRGYIIDDNNDTYDNTTTPGRDGYATGFIKFSNDPFWNNIPLGTIILIYNDDLMSHGQDLDHSDGNLVLKISSNLFLACEAPDNTPAIPPTPLQISSATCGTGIGNPSWSRLKMANTSDVFQILDSDGNSVFSVGWNMDGKTDVHFTGDDDGVTNSGGVVGKVVYLSGGTDPFLKDNWSVGNADPSLNDGIIFETPGAANSFGLGSNDAWITGLTNPNINIANSTIPPSINICGTSQGSLTIPSTVLGVTYKLFDPNGIEVATGTGTNGNLTLSFPGGTNGSYVVKAMREDGDCERTLSNSLVVNTYQPTAIVPNSYSICKDESVTLDASGAVSYTWSPSEELSCSDCANPSFTSSQSGPQEFTVNATDVNGCSSTTTVTVDVQEPIDVNIDGPGDLCKGEGATLTAVGASDNANYFWSSSNSNDELTGADERLNLASIDETTTYTVNVVDGACSDDDNYVMNIIDTDISFEQNIIGSVATFTANNTDPNATLTWYVTSGGLPYNSTTNGNEMTFDATGANSDLFCVRLEVENSCGTFTTDECLPVKIDGCATAQ